MMNMMNVQLHTPAAFPTASIPRRLGGLSNLSGSNKEVKNLIPMPGLEPQLLGRAAHSLVAMLTEVFRLHSF
jgi:hypothetical protein